MKRSITLSSILNLTRYNQDSWAIGIEVAYTELSSVILELQMLEYELVKTIIITSQKINKTINVSLNTNAESEVIVEKENFLVMLSLRDVEFIKSYLLKYYRDYFASVNHIDIELVHKGIFGKDATLVIRAADSMEPMTADAARKILENQ